MTKAKATNAEVLLVVGRLNDAMLMTQELVKQRWTPQAILSMGPGWYENQYFKTLGKLSDGPISFVPWYDPNKKLTTTSWPALPRLFRIVNMNTNHVFTFEALLIAADAYKRAGSTDPKALAEALHTTNITDNVSIGPGIKFDAKGQNDKVKDWRYPEPRQQAGDGRAEGGGQCQAGMADKALPGSRVKPHRCCGG